MYFILIIFTAISSCLSFIPIFGVCSLKPSIMLCLFALHPSLKTDLFGLAAPARSCFSGAQFDAKVICCHPFESASVASILLSVPLGNKCTSLWTSKKNLLKQFPFIKWNKQGRLIAYFGKKVFRILLLFCYRKFFFFNIY